MNTPNSSEGSAPRPSLTDFVYGFAAVGDALFASCGSGLYRSADAGRNWTPMTDSLGTTLHLGDKIPTTGVVLSPEFERDQTLFVAVGGRILRSSDGGTHWRAADLSSPEPVIATLTVSPNYSADEIVLAGTLEDGVFRSADRGGHWAAWNFGLLDLNTLCLAISPDFSQDETIFVGTESGLFRSTNGGRAWREVGLPVGYVAILSVAISPAYAQDSVVFAGTETGILLQSVDGGETWRQTQLPVDAPINGIVLASDYARSPTLLLNLGSCLLLSADNAASWADRYAEQIGVDEISAVIAPWGLSEHEPLIVGFVGGRIQRLEHC